MSSPALRVKLVYIVYRDVVRSVCVMSPTNTENKSDHGAVWAMDLDGTKEPRIRSICRPNDRFSRF